MCSHFSAHACVWVHRAANDPKIHVHAIFYHPALFLGLPVIPHLKNPGKIPALIYLTRKNTLRPCDLWSTKQKLAECDVVLTLQSILMRRSGLMDVSKVCSTKNNETNTDLFILHKHKPWLQSHVGVLLSEWLTINRNFSYIYDVFSKPD